MSTHNICFFGEIMKIIPILSSNTLLICLTVPTIRIRKEVKLILCSMTGQHVNTHKYAISLISKYNGV